MGLIYKTASYLVLLLGIIHTSMTPVFYDSFSKDALWFAGTGLSLIFLGFLNSAALKASIAAIYNICIISNVISVIYFALIVIVLPKPHAFLGVLLVICELTGSVVNRKRLRL